MNWKVLAISITYNQSKYILDTLNGFTMQQTNFPYVCTIIDDASTDGEQEVIMQYMHEHFCMDDKEVAYIQETDYAHFFFAQHKMNKNCYFVACLLKYNHYSRKISYKKLQYIKEWWDDSEYIALCEGDDFWIDSTKLQKQVSFLDTHAEYSLCGSNGFIHWDEGIYKPSYFNRVFANRDVDIQELINGWFFPTASICYRKQVRENYPEWSRKIYSGDQTLVLVAASRGKIYCLGDLACVYRRSVSSKYSVTNRTAVDFMYKQHKLLYTEFNEFTNHKYDSVIQSKVAELERHIEFLNWVNCKSLYFTNPVKYTHRIWEFFVCSKYNGLKNRLRK